MSFTIIAVGAFLVGVLLFLIFFLFFQMKQYKAMYQIPVKPIENMSIKEISRALSSEYLNPTRWIEDLVNVLIWKDVLKKDDFPQAVLIRIEYKQQLRKRLQELNDKESKTSKGVKK
jgi:hypothetical protein